jgi:hypothetical protein
MKSHLSLEKEDLGRLGVAGLKDFWSRQLEKRAPSQTDSFPNDEGFDRLLIDGLGLAIEEALNYLMQNAPAFEEFENWILEKNDGHIDPLTIERINCIIGNLPYSQEIIQSIHEIEESEPVLSKADMEFWDENGYVIARNVISKENAKAAEEAVWQFLDMEPGQPESWYQNKIGKGIMTELYHHPTLNKNRISKRVQKAFAQLWKTGDIWGTTDRAGFNPPEKRGWDFPGPRLHWDMNLTPPFQFGVQGILYLCDVTADQGAFSCVPGFHKTLEEWLEGLPAGADPRTEDLSGRARPIAANAGDLIIWHQFLPHGSSPNRANYPRIVQYMAMYPFSASDERQWK